MNPISPFFPKLSEAINSGQSRSLILCGNIYDLFYSDPDQKYIPLIDFLSAKCKVAPNGPVKGITQLIYRVNSNVVIVGDGDELCEAWAKFKGGKGKENPDADLPSLLAKTNGKPAYAFEILRQLTVCSRESNLKNNLLIIIEAADMSLPQDDIARMNLADRHQIAIVQDWFCDPLFAEGHDTVVLIAESRSQIHRRISSLPQMLSIEIPYPGLDERNCFIVSMIKKANILDVPDRLDVLSAGLTLQALRQLFCRKRITTDDVMQMVEICIIQQLGDGVVEFKRPSHTFKDVRGFSVVKTFLQEEVIPRFRGEPESALTGAAIGGPIGGGKSFIGEALASELGLPVLILKNLRSKWFGDTDVIVERLQRILEVFWKIVIFVDEADTAFGGVEGDVHETEKRLTGKIQAMMSDPALRGRVLWLLMTARINALSADIRRPGRVGDLIIPILDPEDDDRTDFLKWVLEPIKSTDAGDLNILDGMTKGYSSAAFQALRSAIKSKKCSTFADVQEVCEDMIPPDIDLTRRYQTLQALLNCTRFSLMPKWVQAKGRKGLEELRKQWTGETTSLKNTMRGV